MSKIEWTGRTWNPVVGCDRISDGCDLCYAIVMAWRNANMGVEQYKGTAIKTSTGFDWTGRVVCVPSALEIPFTWKTPLLVFPCSMSDLFHEDIPDEYRDRIFDVMESTPHTYQCLTKRHNNQARYIKRRYGSTKSPENIWLGVSVESSQWLIRAKKQAELNTHVQWLSIEPLLEDVAEGLEQHFRSTKTDLRGYWVVVGGESGRTKQVRPFSTQWAERVVEVCHRFKIPVFVKQLGTVELLPNGEVIRHKTKRDDTETIAAAMGKCVREYPARLDLRIGTKQGECNG